MSLPVTIDCKDEHQDWQKVQGMIKVDDLNFHGTIQFKNGLVYCGHVVHGQIQGNGTFTFPENDLEKRKQYCGNIVNGVAHGKGVLVLKDGSKYDGEFQHDKRHGQGVQVYEDGSKYDGEWKDGQKHGKGFMSWNSGNKYDGEWQNNKRHGKGVCVYEDGEKYDGEFQNGERHGQGVCVFKNGSKYDGEWQSGKMHGKGVCVYEDGAKYDGEFQNGERHGKGVYVFQNGSKYDGEFQSGKRYGKGVEVFQNGSKYDGEWQNDKRHGNGVMVYVHGTKQNVAWNNGVQIPYIIKKRQHAEIKDESWPRNPCELQRGVNDTWNAYQIAHKGRQVTSAEWKAEREILWRANENMRTQGDTQTCLTHRAPDKPSADTEFHGQARKKMRINEGVSSVRNTNQKQEGSSVANEQHWQTVFDLANLVTEKEHGR